MELERRKPSNGGANKHKYFNKLKPHIKLNPNYNSIQDQLYFLSYDSFKFTSVICYVCSGEVSIEILFWVLDFAANRTKVCKKFTSSDFIWL